MANNNLQEIRLGAPLSIEGGASPNASLTAQSLDRCTSITLHDDDDGTKCTKDGAVIAASKLVMGGDVILHKSDNASLFKMLESAGVKHNDPNLMTADEITGAQIGRFDAAELAAAAGLNESDVTSFLAGGDSILKLLIMCFTLSVAGCTNLSEADISGMVRLIHFDSRGSSTSIVGTDGCGNLRRARFGSPQSIVLGDCCLQEMTTEDEESIENVSIATEREGSRLFHALTLLFNSTINDIYHN